jgi:hypothetical protein
MVQLKWLKEETSPLKKERMRAGVRQYLLDKCDTIRLHEASINGNTALHFTLWNQEYELAQMILNTANQQGGTALANVLAARNNLGMAAKTTVASGGEVPHMNLVAQMAKLDISACFDALNQILNAAIVSEKVNLERLKETLDKNNPLESTLKALALIQEASPEEDLSAYIQNLHQLRCFTRTYDLIHKNLGAAGQAEMGHLLSVYQKAAEGYCAFNFLQQAPIVVLNRDIQRLRTMQLPADLANLPMDLTDLVASMQESKKVKIAASIDAWFTNNSVVAPATQDLREALGKVRIHLNQLTHFQGKAANLTDSTHQQAAQSVGEVKDLLVDLQNIKPLLTEKDRLDKEIKQMEDSLVGTFFSPVAYPALLAVQTRLKEFLDEYNRICTDHQQNKNIDKLKAGLTNLFKSPENAIFKNHPGVWGAFLNVLNKFAQWAFGSDKFKTETEKTLDKLSQEANIKFSPGAPAG